MVEGASLDWIANPSVSRDELRELLVVGYAAVLAKAMEMDPKVAVAAVAKKSSG